MNVFKTSIFKRPFQASPRRVQACAVAAAVGGVGQTPAGNAVLGLLVRFFEFSLLFAVLLFFGSGLLFSLRDVIVLTCRGPGTDFPGR